MLDVKKLDSKILSKFEVSDGRFKSGLARVQIDGKWGAVNRFGEMVLEAKYDEIDISNDYFDVGIRIGDKWGLSDVAGNILFEPQMDMEFDLYNTITIVKKDGKFGVITPAGFVIEPKFDELYTSENFESNVSVFICKVGDKFGLVTWQTKMLLEPICDEIGEFDFYSGIARVKIDGQTKWLSISGEILDENIELEDEDGWCLGCKIVYDEDSGEYGIKDINGKWIRKPTYDEIVDWTDEEILLWECLWDYSHYIFDPSNRTFLDYKMDSIEEISTYDDFYDDNYTTHGLIKITGWHGDNEEMQSSLLNQAGFEPEACYKGIVIDIDSRLMCGLRFVQYSGYNKWAFINSQGKIVTSAGFKDSNAKNLLLIDFDRNVHDAMFCAQDSKSGKFGIVDLASGKWLLKPKFDEPLDYVNGKWLS